MKNLFTIGCTILFALNLIQIGSTEPSFELREGECDETSNGTASGEDLVYKDRITLESLPFFSRTEETLWYGDGKIYCILALRRYDGFNSTVEIIKGGVNHAYVYIKYRTAPGQALDYIDIWYGDAKIYCILVLSNYESDVQSTVEIVEGGVNHTYVGLQYTSDIAQPLDYDVKVYGKPI